MRQWAPHVPTVFLMDSVPRLLRGGGLPLDVRITGPSIDIVRAHPSYVRRAQQAGHAVHVWVVNDPADLGLCYELEVDAVITDRPSETVDLLRSWA